MNWKAKLTIVCAMLICLIGTVWIATPSQRSPNTLTYSQFLQKVRTGQVASVIVIGSNSGVVHAICRLKVGDTERTVLPQDYREAMLMMQDKLVNVEIRDSSSEARRLFISVLPFFLLLGLWIVLVIRKFPNGRFMRPLMHR